MEAGNGHDNNRVTLAVLGEKIDALRVQIDEVLERMQRTEAAVHHQDIKIAEEHGSLGHEVMRLDGRIDRTEDRIRGWQAGQGALTVIASAIAGWIGWRN